MLFLHDKEGNLRDQALTAFFTKVIEYDLLTLECVLWVDQFFSRASSFFPCYFPIYLLLFHDYNYKPLVGPVLCLEISVGCA